MVRSSCGSRRWEGEICGEGTRGATGLGQRWVYGVQARVLSVVSMSEVEK